VAELNSINKIVSNDRNGGVSSFFAKLSYQKKLALVKRGVPDTGYIIHMNGADYVVAALIALIN
jgi:citrate lyase synthetase